MPTDQATIVKQAQAAAWALNQIGRRDYINLCQRFIENAYGTSGRYATAAAAGNALNMSTDPMTADVGDLVFFRPDASNGGAGHVGINIGNGQMVSSTNRGVQVDNFLTNPYWKNLLVGIGDPPPQWEGRADAKDLVSGATTMVAQAKATAGNPVAAAWGAAAPYAQQLIAASQKHGVPVNLLAGLLIQESGGDPRAVSRAGAQGLMQFMPGTARGLGIDPFDPAQAIDAGARYLKQLADSKGGDWQWAVGAYNAGPGGNQNNAETRNHIQKVMGFASGIGASMGAAGAAGGGVPPPGGGGRRPEDENVPQQNQQQKSGLQNLLDIIGNLSGWDSPRTQPPQAPSAGDVAGAVASAGGLNDNPRTGQAHGNQATAGQIVGGAVGNAQGAGDQIAISINDLQRALSGGDRGFIDFLMGLARGASPSGAAIGGAAIQNGNRPLIPGASGAIGGSIAQGLPVPGLPGILSGGTPPGGPGGPGGGKPPGRNDDAFTRGIAGQESRDQPGPAGARAAPANANARPKGWVDPTPYQGTDRMQIEQANALLAQIEDAQARLARNPQDFDAQEQLTNAQTLLRQMGPVLADIQSRYEKRTDAQQGQVLPGTSPSSNFINIIKQNPDGTWSLQQIPNPNPEPSAADIAAGASRYGADVAAGASRYGADVSAGASRYASDTSRANALTSADASRDVAGINAGAQIGSAQIGALSAANVANINSATQRTIAALQSATEQQKNLISAQIARGDLSLREGMARYDQWKQQNVDVPLAILKEKREAELYRLQQQQNVTARATSQAEHERGSAQIAQQMWQAAAQAYNQTIPNTVGRGFGEAFQRNLSTPGPYQAIPGVTFDTPYSMEDFANQAADRLRATITPYGGILSAATQSVGDPGTAMSGDQMSGLTTSAVNTVQGALNNPYTMGPVPGIDTPQPINPADYVGTGQGGAPQLQLPDFTQAGAGVGRG